MVKEIATQVQKPRESQTGETQGKIPQDTSHINHTNKDQTQRANIKSSKGRQQITHKGIPIRTTADLSIETLQARREWQDILKVMKGKTYNQDYSTQQGSYSDMKEKSKALQTSKS